MRLHLPLLLCLRLLRLLLLKLLLPRPLLPRLLLRSCTARVPLLLCQQHRLVLRTLLLLLFLQLREHRWRRHAPLVNLARGLDCRRCLHAPLAHAPVCSIRALASDRGRVFAHVCDVRSSEDLRTWVEAHGRMHEMLEQRLRLQALLVRPTILNQINGTRKFRGFPLSLHLLCHPGLEVDC